jgi:hypothetical protein
MPTKQQSVAVMPSRELFGDSNKADYIPIAPLMEPKELDRLTSSLQQDREEIRNQQNFFQVANDDPMLQDPTRRADKALFKQFFEYGQGGGFSKNQDNQQQHEALFDAITELVNAINPGAADAGIGINAKVNNPFAVGYSRYQMLLITQEAGNIAKKEGREFNPHAGDFKAAEEIVLVAECKRYIERMVEISQEEPRRAKSALANIQHVITQFEQKFGNSRSEFLTLLKAYESANNRNSSSSRSASPMSSPASSAPSSPAVSRRPIIGTNWNPFDQRPDTEKGNSSPGMS